MVLVHRGGGAGKLRPLGMLTPTPASVPLSPPPQDKQRQHFPRLLTSCLLFMGP